MVEYKTTHQLASELLALPDVPLMVEGWCQMEGHEVVATMTEYDPTGAAILMQALLPSSEDNAQQFIAALDPSFVEGPVGPEGITGPVGHRGTPGPCGPDCSGCCPCEPSTLSFERVSIYTDSEDLGFEGTALPDMLASISEGISKLLEASAEEGKPVRSVILEAVTCADEPGRAQLFAHLLR